MMITVTCSHSGETYCKRSFSVFIESIEFAGGRTTNLISHINRWKSESQYKPFNNYWVFFSTKAEKLGEMVDFDEIRPLATNF